MSELPSPKKQPKQSRSIALVEAVLEASLKLLDSEQEDSLTMEKLSETSGVAVGSIYQYFENKEGVISAAYKNILRQESEVLAGIGEQVKSLNVPESLRLIFSNALRVELRFHRLSKSFHEKYYKELHLSEHYKGDKRNIDSVEVLWLDFIEYFSDQVSPNDKRIVALMLARGYRDMTRAIMEADPKMVTSDIFVDNLVAMALACLNYKASGPSTPSL